MKITLFTLVLCAWNVDAVLIAKSVAEVSSGRKESQTDDMASTKSTATADDDEGAEDDGEDENVCAPIEASLKKTNKALAANSQKRTELQQARKHVGAQTGQEIDAVAVLVENQTESKALAGMLSHMWKDMRMFETPAFKEYIQKEMKELERDEQTLRKRERDVKAELKECKADPVAFKNHEEAPTVTSKKKNAGLQAMPDEKDFQESSEEVVENQLRTSVWHMQGNLRTHAIIGSCFYLLAGFLVAFLYKRYLTHQFLPELQSDKFSSADDFSFSLFGCFSVPRMCFLGCCCPCLMWADTLERKGLLSFWKAFAAFFGLIWLHMYTMGISSIVLIVLGIVYRQKLRGIYQIKKGSADTVCWDILAWSFCQSCAIIQEAREDAVLHTFNEP